jgi:hypothetical protein
MILYLLHLVILTLESHPQQLQGEIMLGRQLQHGNIPEILYLPQGILILLPLLLPETIVTPIPLLLVTLFHHVMIIVVLHQVQIVTIENQNVTVTIVILIHRLLPPVVILIHRLPPPVVILIHHHVITLLPQTIIHMFQPILLNLLVIQEVVSPILMLLNLPLLIALIMIPDQTPKLMHTVV